MGSRWGKRKWGCARALTPTLIKQLCQAHGTAYWHYDGSYLGSVLEINYQGLSQEIRAISQGWSLLGPVCILPKIMPGETPPSRLM